MLAMARVIGGRYEEMLAAAKGDHDTLTQLEREEVGADHVEVGTWLLQRWRVPALLVTMAGGSHNPTSVSAEASEETQFLVNVVAISGRFADIWIHKDALAATARLRQMNERIFGQHQLDVDAICQRLLEATPAVASLLDVQLDAQEMASVLDEAQEALVVAMAELELSTETMLKEAQRDHLTGIPNRSQLETQITRLFEDATTRAQRLGVIFVDVDHFKRINDSYGHAAGDSVLQSVAQILANGLRKYDFIGRYGGEEFVILLPGACVAELQIVGERLRSRIEAANHSIGSDCSIKATISLGCANFDAKRHLHAKHLIEEADQAMYAAKEAGRNRAMFLHEATVISRLAEPILANI